MEKRGLDSTDDGDVTWPATTVSRK